MKDDNHANGVRESVGIGSGTSTGVDEAGAAGAAEMLAFYRARARHALALERGASNVGAMMELYDPVAPRAASTEQPAAQPAPMAGVYCV